ncbi:glycosyltransferase [bacterium]|nr:glycosyltransferase [bacterium]
MSNGMPRRVLVIFLGRRGGGNLLVRNLIRYQNSHNEKCEWLLWNSSRNRSLEDFAQETDVEHVKFEIPHRRSELSNPFRLILSVSSILRFRNELRKSRPVLLVQIMPSPFDYFIDYFARRQGVYVTRLIHDAVAHLGESWPKRRAIQIRIKRANHIIFFSDFVRNETQALFENQLIGKKLSLAQLPAMANPIDTPGLTFFNGDEKSKNLMKVAFLGRAIEYKGLNTLALALEDLEIKVNFVAAGLGEYPKSLLEYHKVVNRWLSDDEFSSIMKESDVVVLPYVEASQSGIIPLARKMGKWILATNVGGLSEQLERYERAVIVDVGSHEALASGLAKIHESWSQTHGGPPHIDRDSTLPELGDLIRDLASELM